MAKKMPAKDPADVLDYLFDFQPWLGQDNITDHLITVETGITLDSSTRPDNKQVKVWLSGGTAGVNYVVSCKITTAGGRQKTRSMLIPMSEG